jgi:hypothetical protein
MLAVAINGDYHDCRRANIRRQTRHTDKVERATLPQSGYAYIWWTPQLGRWKVEIPLNGSNDRRHVGTYKTVREAVEAQGQAYAEARQAAAT